MAQANGDVAQLQQFLIDNAQDLTKLGVDVTVKGEGAIGNSLTGKPDDFMWAREGDSATSTALQELILLGQIRAGVATADLTTVWDKDTKGMLSEFLVSKGFDEEKVAGFIKDADVISIKRSTTELDGRLSDDYHGSANVDKAIFAEKVAQIKQSPEGSTIDYPAARAAEKAATEEYRAEQIARELDKQGPEEEALIYPRADGTDTPPEMSDAEREAAKEHNFHQKAGPADGIGPSHLNLTNIDLNTEEGIAAAFALEPVDAVLTEADTDAAIAAYVASDFGHPEERVDEDSFAAAVKSENTGGYAADVMTPTTPPSVKMGELLATLPSADSAVPEMETMVADTTTETTDMSFNEAIAAETVASPMDGIASFKSSEAELAPSHTKTPIDDVSPMLAGTSNETVSPLEANTSLEDALNVSPMMAETGHNSGESPIEKEPQPEEAVAKTEEPSLIDKMMAHAPFPLKAVFGLASAIFGGPDGNATEMVADAAQETTGQTPTSEATVTQQAPAGDPSNLDQQIAAISDMDITKLASL